MFCFRNYFLLVCLELFLLIVVYYLFLMNKSLTSSILRGRAPSPQLFPMWPVWKDYPCIYFMLHICKYIYNRISNCRKTMSKCVYLNFDRYCWIVLLRNCQIWQYHLLLLPPANTVYVTFFFFYFCQSFRYKYISLIIIENWKIKIRRHVDNSITNNKKNDFFWCLILTSVYNP